jgi:hypothetical protein
MKQLSQIGINLESDCQLIYSFAMGELEDQNEYKITKGSDSPRSILPFIRGDYKEK